jgi:hypothetical protein
MSSFNSTNTFSSSTIENIAIDVALKTSWEILGIFHSMGISTNMVGTHHKAAMRELGAKVLRAAADKFEQLVE